MESLSIHLLIWQHIQLPLLQLIIKQYLKKSHFHIEKSINQSELFLIIYNLKKIIITFIVYHIKQ